MRSYHRRVSSYGSQSSLDSTHSLRRSTGVVPSKFLLSKTNTMQSSLPGFLRVKHASQHLLSHHTIHYTPRKSVLQSQRLQLPNTSLLTVSNRNPKRVQPQKADIQDLKQGPLSASLLDFCLSVLKKLNSELLSKGQVTDRVLIANTNMASSIFHSRKFTPTKTNIFRYEQDLYSFLLFPIFTTHWSLLAANMREKTVCFHDPKNCFKPIQTFRMCVYEFMKVQLQFHQGNLISDSAWSFFQYEEAKVEREVEDDDSGVFVLKVIYNYVKGRREEIKHLKRFRKEIFQYIRSK